MKPQSASSERENVGCDLRWEDYSRLAHKLAHRAHRRLVARGISVEYEDVFQEMAMTWVKAKESFDPNRGVQFSTYYVKASMLNINRWASQLYNVNDNVLWVPLDEPANEDSRLDLSEVIADDNAVNPEQEIIAKSVRRRIEKKMPKAAVRVIEILEDPPPLLLQEISKLQSWSEWAKARGMDTKRPRRELNLTMIMELSNLTRVQRGAVYRALKKLL